MNVSIGSSKATRAFAAKLEREQKRVLKELKAVVKESAWFRDYKAPKKADK